MGDSWASTSAVKTLCPGGRAREGSLLIGAVNRSGMIGSISPPLPVTKEFVTAAGGSQKAERRFRFAEPCAASRCANWQQGGCAVARSAAAAGRDVRAEILPPCSIRAACRWYRQDGGDACVACPLIVRLMTELPMAPNQ